MSLPEPKGVPVEGTSPIRVLLVGRDRRFLRTAEVLLRRRGHDVTRIERPSELLERVSRERPDVVVLDGSDSLNATARTVAALDSLPGVHPLVLFEGAGDDALGKLRLRPKWGPFDDIVLAIERLHALGQT